MTSLESFLLFFLSLRDHNKNKAFGLLYVTPAMKFFLLFLETIAIYNLAFPSTATFSFQFLARIIIVIFYFYLGFLSQTLTIHATAGEGRGRFHSYLPLSTTYEFSDIVLQVCNWNDSR